MKKAKPKGELSLVDSTTATTTTTTYFGVRTRAKTLALQKSQPQQPDLSPSSGSYLQLRSRRLHKPPISQHSSKRPKPQNPKSPIPSSTTTLRLASSQHDAHTQQQQQQEKSPHQNPDAEEASFGENVLDFEGRERWVFLRFFSLVFFQSTKVF